MDLRSALEEARSRGSAFVESAIDASLLERIQDEAERLPLERWPEVIGKVRQNMDGCFLRLPLDAHPAIHALAESLASAVHTSAIRGLRTWRPNEVSVQRYRPGLTAIEPHRDNIRYRRLIAILTTKGRARFRVLDGRKGAVLAEWTPQPGDLVLLRGPGLGGSRDGRPFHALDAPADGERWSVAFRMDDRGGETQRFLSQEAQSNRD